MFLGIAGRAVAATAGVGAIALRSDAAQEGPESKESDSDPAKKRAQESFRLRVNAATAERNLPLPPHATNGDEDLYPNRIGNYSKGLPHNSIGEVDQLAYDGLLSALNCGNPDDFDRIPMGGNVLLVNPQSGLAFDMEGCDAHQPAMDPPPPLASAARAAEAVECYWMSLLRDVNFEDYETDSIAQAACAELSRLKNFNGPKNGRQVTPNTLFRGFTAGDHSRPLRLAISYKTS